MNRYNTLIINFLNSLIKTGHMTDYVLLIQKCLPPVINRAPELASSTNQGWKLVN